MLQNEFSKYPVSMVVTGLVEKRLSNKLHLESVISSFIMFKNINPQNEIIVSTYKDEIPKSLLKYIDRKIINSDPGPDIYMNHRWLFIKKSSGVLTSENYSRYFLTNYTGIKSCKNSLVVKARIEMLPSDPELFLKLLEQYLTYQVSSIPVMGFFTEHYSGVRFSVDGILGGIPGTVIFGTKKTLERLYFESMTLWQNEKKRFTSRKHRHVITAEQILGLNFLFLFLGFPLYSKLHKLSKYYVSIQLIRSIVIAEKKNFIFLNLKKSGFIMHKYQGTLFVKTPANIHKLTQIQILTKFVIFLAKRYKHRLKKYIQALRVSKTKKQ